MTDMTRRTALTALTVAATAAAGLPAAIAAAQPPRRSWPERFVWGTATAAHQIEGNNVGSDYWLLEHLPGTNFKEPSGDACDSWNRWREDVAMLRELGVTTYRFSIEWARIEPEPGAWSLATLDQYRRQCAALREAGILPIVTFHHFTSPRWIAAQGGWENPDTADRFARYAERAARAIGDLIGAACTLNEPNAQVTSYVMRGSQPFAGEAAIIAAARRALGSDRFGSYFMGDSFKVRDVCLAAHARGRAAIKSVMPQLKVGMTLALQDLVPTPGGEALHKRIFDNARALFYAAAAKDDFLGVQPYMRYRIGPAGYLRAPDGVPLNASGAEASPDVISAVLKEAWRHARVPLFVTENGIETEDEALRERHLAETLDHLHTTIAGGIPVLGYIHWSLMDNFEWRSGYGPRFGLYAVDRTTFARRAKPAAARYAALVAAARPVRIEGLL
ncbi:family 1 glycosylhydrolase [Sphingobium algorifonticola]|nr:family 1 glycosylhydrolase [Sphingobium algorifonticola]